MSVTEKQQKDVSSTEEAAISSPELSIAEGGSSSVNEKKLLRKLDYRLLPPLTLIYLMSFLDRSNGRSLLPLRALPHFGEANRTSLCSWKRTA